MKGKAHTQKNTLLKAAEANAAIKAFKRVFFSPTQEEIQIIFFPSLRFFNYLFFQRTVLIRADIASNVNRFEQSVCGLWTERLRTKSRAAGNKKILCYHPNVFELFYVLLQNQIRAVIEPAR